MSIKFCYVLYAITCVHGFHSISVPKAEKPKVFGFGYPTPLLVNASIKTIPLEGIVQYDLLFTNSTDLCDTQYNRGNVIALDGCHFTKNQTVSKLNSGRSLNCTICNSTANCVSLGIKRDQYFSLWLIAKAQNYSISSSCIGKVYNEDIVVVQPRSFQVIATKRRQVTASWKRPHGISYTEGWRSMMCVVMSSNGDGAMEKCTKEYIYVQGNITTRSFNNSVMPWTEYSLTVCCAFNVDELGDNNASCTCGKPPYVIPSGAVSIRTLPEEPTEAPELQPCKASCGERLNVTLTWRVGADVLTTLKYKILNSSKLSKDNLAVIEQGVESLANDKQVWNGFPVNSTITVRRIAQEKFDFPVSNLSVPLPQDYNGSLLSYTIQSLAVEGTFLASVKFCSNGGCGPASKATLSCEQCLLINSETTSAKSVPSKSPKPSSWLVIASVCGFALVVVIAIISICWYKRNYQQPRENVQPLLELFNDEDVPENYDRVSDGPANTDEYDRIARDDTQSILPTGHSEEVV